MAAAPCHHQRRGRRTLLLPAAAAPSLLLLLLLALASSGPHGALAQIDTSSAFLGQLAAGGAAGAPNATTVRRCAHALGSPRVLLALSAHTAVHSRTACTCARRRLRRSATAPRPHGW